MTKRVFAVAAAVAVALVWAGAPVSAQTYPPPVRSITVDDATPAPGQAITVTLRTCRPGTVALLGIGLKIVGTPRVGADGVARATVTVPARLRPGRHTVSGLCLAPDLTPLFLTTVITVTAPAGGGGGGGGGGAGGAVPPPGGSGGLGAPAGATTGAEAGAGGAGGSSSRPTAAPSPAGLGGPTVPADAPMLFETTAAANGVTDGADSDAQAPAPRSGSDGAAAADGDPGALSTIARVALVVAALGGVPVALAVSRRPRRAVRQRFA